MADAGREGGGMLLSGLKNPEFLRPFTAGEDGRCDRLSMVRSTNDGLEDFEARVCGSVRSSLVYSGSPSRNPARDEARDDERNPSKSPKPSSSRFMLLLDGVGDGLTRDCRDCGRPIGFLNTDKSSVEGLVCKLLGAVRFIVLEEVEVEGVGLARDCRDGFFWTVGWAVPGFEKDETDDLSRSLD